jgi:hypothetical protein
LKLYSKRFKEEGKTKKGGGLYLRD